MAIGLGILWVTIALMAATKVFAQTPVPTPAMHPDVHWVRAGAVYNGGCVAPPDADMHSLCFVRTDVTPEVELGCADAGPSESIRKDLTIPETPGDDAEIHCYALDNDGLRSDNSPNMATVDFTRPGTPYVE